MITKLKIEQIRIDGGTQNRVEINQSTVNEYAELIMDGVQFPPVKAFFDGASYWLADGFHRYWAHKNINNIDIDVDIEDGSLRDAKLFSYGANKAHGLRRTNEDKRNSIIGMLTDFGDWSDSQIAKHCGVSNSTVGQYRKSLCESQSEKPQERTYTTKHGTTAVMKTQNIGKSHQNKQETEQKSKVVEYDFQEESDYDPEQDQINELSHTINDLQEENEKLRSALAINQIPEGLEIEDADTIIDNLRARVKQLEIEVKAITQSRDTYLRENSQLKEQIRRQAAQLKKLGVKASA